MRIIIKIVFLLSIFNILGVTQIEAAQIVSSGKFISISDIHFDPFIGCNQLPHPCPIISALQASDTQKWDAIFEKYSAVMKTRYYSDTDYALLKSGFAELKKLNTQEKPAFVLLLGDYLAHGFSEKYKRYSGDRSAPGYHAFVKKIIFYLSDKLNQTSTITSFYPVIGNNDSYDGDYNSTPHSDFLLDSAISFKKLIRNTQQQKLFFNEFSSNGYYSILLNNNSRLIVLNSVFFSKKDTDDSVPAAAEAELHWFELELKKATQHHQKVLIALHIPPGIDVFTGLRKHFDVIRAIWHSLFWQENYNQQFLDLIKQYAMIISGVLPGHIHADAFQILYTPKIDYFIPVSYTPPISPVFGNNPGLKVFTFNLKTLDLINFDTYFYPLQQAPNTTWQKEYNFNATYQADCHQSCSIVAGMLRLTKDNHLVDFYKQYYTVSGDAHPITTDTKNNTWALYYWCPVQNLTWSAYQSCLTIMSKGVHAETAAQ